ncbi:MAG: hypothetical protein DWQ06_07750 [Calditrichaeota bacterium]|nr:MAG: hypothetical protein DWQ06_07750 [Calditrichota bacterium]
MKEFFPMSSKYEKYQEVYKTEFDTLKKSQKFIKDKDNLSNEELLKEYKLLSEKYDLLLNDTVKMTKIGDSFQQKLLKANDTIQEQFQKVQKLNKAQEEILGIVAHDLRNPITAISWTCELIEDDFEEEMGEEGKEYVQMIQGSCDSMNFLINDLLEVAKLESDDYALEVQPENICVLIREAIERLAEKFDDKSIHLSLELGEEEIIVMAHRERIWQLVSNLITNAVKFTENGGTIIVSTELKDDKVLIKFSDNGIGIPPEKIPILFDKFTKASRKGTKGESSTGLGMSITKRLVELHFGKIWVESEVGKGTDFFVEFPLKK